MDNPKKEKIDKVYKYIDTISKTALFICLGNEHFEVQYRIDTADMIRLYFGKCGMSGTSEMADADNLINTVRSVSDIHIYWEGHKDNILATLPKNITINVYRTKDLGLFFLTGIEFK